MNLTLAAAVLSWAVIVQYGNAVDSNSRHQSAAQDLLGPALGDAKHAETCPDYQIYASVPQCVFFSTSVSISNSHSPPLSSGPLALPYQRPSVRCRTFSSPVVEKIINDVTVRMENKDLARLFENAFPNTLDTTVRWHDDGSSSNHRIDELDEVWEGPQSFIVTGDINAEWLRDSTNQLAQYQRLAGKDRKLERLILGAINTQAEYVITSPYCNAFQPPLRSLVQPTSNERDTVHPGYDPRQVFECKYELDSLAHFLALGNQLHNNTRTTDFLTPRWYMALDSLLAVLTAQSKPTFHPVTAKFEKNEYSFQRLTNAGTETLSLGGLGYPLNDGTGLVRSAFRPSDDATILAFLIPANAMMAVELRRTSEVIKSSRRELAKTLLKLSDKIEKGIWKYGVVTHAKYGKVFAYEVDGYGSRIIMDDANLPSLLALPLIGFLEASNKIYQNTRKMILEKEGNAYYLSGKDFAAVGGPHIGLQYAWPISRLVQVMTSSEDQEIVDSLNAVMKISHLGLMHESVNVDRAAHYTSELDFSLSSRLINFWQEAGSLGPIPFLRRPFWTLQPESLIYCLEQMQNHILFKN